MTTDKTQAANEDLNMWLKTLEKPEGGHHVTITGCRPFINSLIVCIICILKLDSGGCKLHSAEPCDHEAIILAQF